MKESMLDIVKKSEVLSQDERMGDKEKCTILHCRIFCTSPTNMRIWPVTVLKEDTGTERRLIHAIGISKYPHWTPANISNGFFHFTLVFEGLTSECKEFLLVEFIAPEPGGFLSDVIRRNKTDVYEAELEAL